MRENASRQITQEENAIAINVNEFPSQDVENELYMIQSGDVCSISP